MTHPYTRFFILPSAPTVDEDETEGYEIGDVVFYDGSFYDLSDATAGAAVWTLRNSSAPTDWGGIGGTLSDQTDLQAALDGKQPIDSDLTAIAAITPSNDDIIQRKAGEWVNRSLSQLITDLVSGLSTLYAAITHNHDHGGLIGLSDDDHPQYTRHNLSTASNDFLVGSGSNTWIKKTLAETITILRTSLDSIFAPASQGVTNGDDHDHTGGDGDTIDHGGLNGLSDDDHTQYVRHDLSTAADDFLVGSGSNTWIKKTKAQAAAILQTLLDLEYAGITEGVTTGDAHTHVGGLGGTISHNNLANIAVLTHTELDDYVGNGWMPFPDAWTRTGNHTFTIAGGDFTAIFRKYTRVKYNDGAVEYGVVLSSSHAAGTTTVNLMPNTNYSMAATTITGKYVSYVQKPNGFPDKFDWTSSPTITLGSGTLVAKCFPGVDGWMDYEWSLDLNSTTMAALNFTPPAPCTHSGARVPVGLVTFLDASPAASYPGCVLYINGSAVFGVRAFNASATHDTQVAISTTIPFTWANSDGLYISGRYPY